MTTNHIHSNFNYSHFLVYWGILFNGYFQVSLHDNLIKALHHITDDLQHRTEMYTDPTMHATSNMEQTRVMSLGK